MFRTCARDASKQEVRSEQAGVAASSALADGVQVEIEESFLGLRGGNKAVFVGRFRTRIVGGGLPADGDSVDGRRDFAPCRGCFSRLHDSSSSLSSF